MRSTRLLIVGLCILCSNLLGVAILFQKLRARPGTREANFPNCGMGNDNPDNFPERVAADKKLAVVVPIHAGDSTRAINSLSVWPTACAHSTLRNVDLVIYYAGDLDDEESDIFRIPDEASRCFRATKMVSARLTEEVGRRPFAKSLPK